MVPPRGCCCCWLYRVGFHHSAKVGRWVAFTAPKFLSGKQPHRVRWETFLPPLPLALARFCLLQVDHRLDDCYLSDQRARNDRHVGSSNLSRCGGACASMAPDLPMAHLLSPTTHGGGTRSVAGSPAGTAIRNFVSCRRWRDSTSGSSVACPTALAADSP